MITRIPYSSLAPLAWGGFGAGWDAGFVANDGRLAIYTEKKWISLCVPSKNQADYCWSAEWYWYSLKWHWTPVSCLITSSICTFSIEILSSFCFSKFCPIWYHSAFAWRVVTNNFRCFLISLNSSFFMFKSNSSDTLSTIKCLDTYTTQHQLIAEQTGPMLPWETKHSIICPWGADGWSCWFWLWQWAIWATNYFALAF